MDPSTCSSAVPHVSPTRLNYLPKQSCCNVRDILSNVYPGTQLTESVLHLMPTQRRTHFPFSKLWRKPQSFTFEQFLLLDNYYDKHKQEATTSEHCA